MAVTDAGTEPKRRDEDHRRGLRQIGQTSRPVPALSTSE